MLSPIGYVTVLAILVLVTYYYSIFSSTITIPMSQTSCTELIDENSNFWYFMMVRCDRDPQLESNSDYYCVVVNWCRDEQKRKAVQHSRDFRFDLQTAEELLINSIETITIAPFLLFPSDYSLNQNVDSDLTMFRDFKRIGERPGTDRSVFQGTASRVADGQHVFLKITPRAEAWKYRKFEQEIASAYRMERFDWGPFVVLVRTPLDENTIDE